MSLQALSTKRIRRTWEPETKSWNDDALDRPWEEIAENLHKATIFSLKNVFFFSHATSIQAKAIAALVENGHSAVIEAPTGSGKTLSFLIPIMERTVRMCEQYVQTHQRPPLTRSISGVILSPSTTLAEQTYLVARNLAARFPFNIQFVLCDGLMERPIHVMTRLCKIARGGSLFLVTTPRYLQEMLTLQSSSSLSSSSSSSKTQKGKCGHDSINLHQTNTRNNKNSLKQQQKEKEDVDNICEEQTNSLLQFGTLTKDQRFVVVVDEADLVFSSSEMRSIVSDFIDMYCVDAHCKSEQSQFAHNNFQKEKSKDTHNSIRSGSSNSCNFESNNMKASKQKRVKKSCNQDSCNTTISTIDNINIKNSNKGRKKDALEEINDTHIEQVSKQEYTTSLHEKLLSDFVFVGATVTTSNELMLFAENVCKANTSTLHRVTAYSDDNTTICANNNDDDHAKTLDNINKMECDYLQLLENKYVLCEANSFLPYLVQLLNMHPSKKHFVFFNHTATLQFVEQLFSKLSGDTRPLLYIKNVYTMHEHLSERVRMMQYNAFLQHSTTRQSNPHKGAKTEKAMHHKSNLHSMLSRERKNQVFTSGWKRDGKPEMGTGAILLCTDVAAFGLDVRDVDYVYHFEPPFSVQSYIHRIGRVGRMGLRGCSVLLLPCITNDKVELAEEDSNSSANNTETSMIMRAASNAYSVNNTRSILKSKNATRSLHAKSITTHHLSIAQQTYLELLSLHSSLQE